MQPRRGKRAARGARGVVFAWPDEQVRQGLVSIVVPVFNGARFLTAALQSLLTQTYPRWEAVVVDDGSTDQSLDVAASMARRDPRIRVVRQPNNRGPSAARNRGLLECRGELVQFLDADDRLCAHKLADQVAYLNAHPEVDIVTGDVRYFDARGWLDDVGPSPPGSDLVADLLLRNFICIDGPLLRRRVLATIGGFQSHTERGERVYGCEDWDLWLRAALAGCRLAYVPGVVAHNCWHASNAQRDRVRMLRFALWALAENSNALAPHHRPWWWLSVAEKRLALLTARHLPQAHTAPPLVRLWRGMGRLARSRTLSR